MPCGGIHAKNEAEQLPGIHLHVARACLQAGDASVASRTWQASPIGPSPTVGLETTTWRNRVLVEVVPEEGIEPPTKGL